MSATAIIVTTVSVLVALFVGALLGRSTEKARRLQEVEAMRVKLADLHARQYRLERESTRKIAEAKRVLDRAIKHRSNSPLSMEEAKQLLEEANEAWARFSLLH